MTELKRFYASLSRRPWLVTSLAGVVVAAYVGVALILPRFEPLIGLLVDSQARQSAADLQVELQSLTERQREVENAIAAVERRLEGEGFTTQSMLHVRKHAAASGLQLTSARLSRGSRSIGAGIDLEAIGDYHATGRFVDAIERGSIPLQIRKISLSSAQREQSIRVALEIGIPELTNGSMR